MVIKNSRLVTNPALAIKLLQYAPVLPDRENKKLKDLILAAEKAKESTEEVKEPLKRKNIVDISTPINLKARVTRSVTKKQRSEPIPKTMEILQDENLILLNDSIPHNEKVEIINKDGGHIKISPYDPQAEPVNIKQLHQAIKKEYGTINLIDILKESELQIEFTNLVQTVASRESIPREVLQFRILLCLYAIGTNTGLKCVSSANESVSYDDLRYVKRRYITVENVRLILVEIVNKILKMRDPRIWGTATTSVACDSKKISVWDQNLMVEWHARYKGRGVMVYWHVDENALCIYSQLKTCSSSEVGSMLKGILQHCTNMEINQVYCDTHGQSTLAFGVSELLNFDLLPRLKNIYSQKLYYPSSSQKGEYKNLDLILKEPINWKLIEDNYDEAIKHVIALKIGTMEPDVFVKRFSKDNYQHPVYRAIIEIGKISKTIFLCRYLMLEELRIEIHEAQNVVERLNSVMGFIFYGKLGEISTNIKEYQELGIVCLHLLQACMAYINTLIFQKVLSRPEWQNILTLEDKRALNVLFHSHINPYGLFPLDLSKRLGIELPHYPGGMGRVKLPAAWLIEHAGFAKGFALGRAGISSRHTLALINRGGATAADLLALRDLIIAGVQEKFRIELKMEPVMVGF